MKIDKEDYYIILNEFQKIKHLIPNYAEGLQKREKPPKNLGMRVRWDCFHSCFFDYTFIDKLYKLGMNDDHIDTALRKAMKEIGLPQFAE